MKFDSLFLDHIKQSHFEMNIDLKPVLYRITEYFLRSILTLLLNLVEGDTEWLFYKDREDWRDVVPIPQNDGPVPVVMIAYSDRFKDVHDYFRAVLKSGEKSQRVLDLTEDALEMNPANYTVWHYRREVIKAIGADIKEELAYSREMIEEHPKNYQVKSI